MLAGMILANKTLPKDMVGGNGNCIFGKPFDGEKGKQALGCAAGAYGEKCPIGALQSKFGLPLCGNYNECGACLKKEQPRCR